MILVAQHGRRGARRAASTIDAAALAGELGIPVIETVAIEGRGLPELRDALRARRVPDVPLRPHAARSARPGPHELTRRVRRVEHAVARRASRRRSARATREPLTGLPILAVVLYALYLFVGVFGAQTLVGCSRTAVRRAASIPAAIWLADRFIPFAVRARLPRRPVRPDHDGPDLRDRHRAAGRRDLLPDVRLSRGQRLHPAPGDLLRSHLPRRWG